MQQLLVSRWLSLCCLIVVFLIFLGGLTRLTDSGLSIVEWKPISGVVPPLTISDWESEFSKYQQSPEYQKKNTTMNLPEFKRIFWLEFIHRLAGRVVGLFFLLPLLYFLVTRQIAKKSIPTYFTILLLFCIQGFIGWYMVKSGLVSEPNVSHFRLAMHMIIATIIYTLLFYQMMKNSFDILIISSPVKLHSAKCYCVLAIILVYVQIFLGGLVAGLDGGLVYNSFPLMGNSFVPKEITWSLSVSNFNEAVFVQFIHRIGAYAVCISVICLVISLLKIKHPKLTRAAYTITAAVILQMLLGVFTILYSVPIVVALLHQIFAIILLSSILWSYFLIKTA